MEITITSKNILDNPAINMATVLELTSANQAEVLSGVSTSIRNGNVLRLIPSPSLDITLQHNRSVGGKPFRLFGGADQTLSGSNGDWIDLQQLNSFWMSVNSQVYAPNPLSISRIIPELDLTKAGKILLFKTESKGKRFHLTKVDFVLKTVSGFVQAPELSLGVIGPDYTDFESAISLQGLSTVNTYLPLVVNGISPSIAPGTEVYLNVKQPAMATTYAVAMRYLAYYY